MRTIELGVTITDAAVDEKTTTIFCAPVARDSRCPDCRHDGRYRDTVTRPLTDLPVAGYPLVLQVAVPRYRCRTAQCGRAVFNQDLGKLAAPRASTTRRCARYVLGRLMIDRTTIAAIIRPDQYARLNSVFDAEEHLAVKVAWLIYQKIIAAYADPNRRRGKKAMTTLIESLRRGIPTGLEEIAQLGRALWRRRADILAFFDHHTSNGPARKRHRKPRGTWRPCVQLGAAPSCRGRSTVAGFAPLVEPRARQLEQVAHAVERVIGVLSLHHLVSLYRLCSETKKAAAFLKTHGPNAIRHFHGADAPALRVYQHRDPSNITG
jgi:hypothetical protein